MELLAIADRRVAELNEEIRMLEKQVTKILNVRNVGLLKLGDVDPCHFHPIAFTKKAMSTSNSPSVHVFILWHDRFFSLLPCSRFISFRFNDYIQTKQENAHGKTYFEFQSATVTAQSEAMSARNAQLEIENESLKNELQNSRADYTALQVDMNDVRDYYHQVDIAASKMGHRCEVRKRILPLE